MLALYEHRTLETRALFSMFGAQFETELSDKDEMGLSIVSNHGLEMKFSIFRLYFIVKERSVP